MLNLKCSCQERHNQRLFRTQLHSRFRNPLPTSRFFGVAENCCMLSTIPCSGFLYLQFLAWCHPYILFLIFRVASGHHCWRMRVVPIKTWEFVHVYTLSAYTLVIFRNISVHDYECLSVLLQLCERWRDLEWSCVLKRRWLCLSWHEHFKFKTLQGLILISIIPLEHCEPAALPEHEAYWIRTLHTVISHGLNLIQLMGNHTTLMTTLSLLWVSPLQIYIYIYIYILYIHSPTPWNTTQEHPLLIILYYWLTGARGSGAIGYDYTAPPPGTPPRNTHSS